MKLRSVAIAMIGAAAFAAAYGRVARGAAPPDARKVPLEMWGLETSDEVDIDGVRAAVRAGGGPRVFAGDPAAANAPVLQELSPGRHDITIRRPGCAPRELGIVVEGSTKRAIVFEPTDETCAIPDAPPRR